MNEDFRKCKGTRHSMRFSDSEFKRNNFATSFCRKVQGSLGLGTRVFFNALKKTSNLMSPIICSSKKKQILHYMSRYWYLI